MQLHKHPTRLLFVKLRTYYIKKDSQAAALFLTERLAEESGKHRPGYLPIFTIDAILYLGSLNLALNKSGRLKLLEMLRHRSLGNRQFLVYIAKKQLSCEARNCRMAMRAGCAMALAKRASCS